ncbi:Scr1 family TA system antitoxin-like transcriptional regulator [Polymorphospora sp. NPDC051019]|uniref:Scr1 family TA system antitoxin-like transcriptional regulator n=1 Tax=Polymorphospora sp. NPDC051019 TaxID=3155725 RepID=UPI003415D279
MNGTRFTSTIDPSALGSVMPYKQPPTSLRALWLGEQMRRLRKDRRITLKGAARHLRLNHSALARFERGQWPFLAGRVATLLDVYQVTDPKGRTVLLRLDAEVDRRNAWEADPDDLHHPEPDHEPKPADQENNRMPFQERHQPTVRGQWLAEQLRQLRLDRSLTLQQVAERLPLDWSSLGRFERGEIKPKYDDVAALLDVYHVFDDRQRDVLLSLALDARHGSHWDVDFGDELPYRPYVNLAWLETRATAIRYYATTRIPDLLQTPEYAARLIQTQMGIHQPTPEHRAAVAALNTRKQAFRDGTNRLSAVITETALRNQVGDSHLMDQQINHLHKLARHPRYTINVLPDGHEITARYDTPFTVFDMPDPYPPVAVTQSLAGRLYLEHPRSLRFTVAHDHLQAAAQTHTSHQLHTIQQQTTAEAAASGSRTASGHEPAPTARQSLSVKP